MSYISLNKQNFVSNLDYYAQKIGCKSKLSIALKDNAYGHGIEQIALMCKEYGIENVFVKNINEAKQIEKYNFKSIQVLYGIPSRLTTFDITINSLEDISKIPQKSKVELKIDTGMGRNGILVIEIQEALKLIASNDLDLVGVFSHFCCADENNDITTNQNDIFVKAREIVEQFYSKDKYKKIKFHIANSAGIEKIDNSLYQKARIGIGAYGYCDIKKADENLKPVLSLYANKISSRTINKGDNIGYGSQAFVSNTDNLEVSNYDIGYGDGFFRLNENQTYILPNQKEILGRVSMDSFSIASSEDEVMLFDDVNSLAKLNNTIKYEILTNLKSNIKRIIN